MSDHTASYFINYRGFRYQRLLPPIEAGGKPPERGPYLYDAQEVEQLVSVRTRELCEALATGIDFVTGWMSEAHEAGESERPYILNANLWLKAASAILKDGQP